MGLLLSEHNRRTVRAPSNPLDKCTVVSIFPKDIPIEIKPTISPGYFKIPFGTFEGPGVLVVGPSSWWREIDQNQPLLEIPNSSIQIAESVVNDYCNGLLGCDMSERMPGIFWVPGAKTTNQIKTEFKKELESAREKQKNWFQELVRMADSSWARSNGNPLSVSDDMRMAARELGLLSKDWMNNTQAFEMIRCIACGSLRNPNYPICQTCKAVADPAKTKELGITFAL